MKSPLQRSCLQKSPVQRSRVPSPVQRICMPSPMQRSCVPSPVQRIDRRRRRRRSCRRRVMLKRIDRRRSRRPFATMLHRCSRACNMIIIRENAKKIIHVRCDLNMFCRPLPPKDVVGGSPARAERALRRARWLAHKNLLYQICE